LPDKPPPVHFGPIAVGEKVIIDPPKIKEMQQLHSKMLGVDMGMTAQSPGIDAVADLSPGIAPCLVRA